MEIDRIISALERRTTIPDDGFSFDEINTALDAAIALLKAQQENRLVILPCQIGAVVYTIKQEYEPCLRDPDFCPHSHGHVKCKSETWKCPHDCPVRMVVQRNVCKGFEVREAKPLALSDAGDWEYYEEFFAFHSDYGHYLTREEAEQKADELNSRTLNGEGESLC